jgi:hypothetical protein
VCLYQRYLSSKILQLLEVFTGIDEHPQIKKKTKIINLFFKEFIFFIKIVKKNYYNYSK